MVVGVNPTDLAWDKLAKFVYLVYPLLTPLPMQISALFNQRPLRLSLLAERLCLLMTTNAARGPTEPLKTLFLPTLVRFLFFPIVSIPISMARAAVITTRYVRAGFAPYFIHLSPKIILILRLSL